MIDDLSADYVRDLLSYDSETGELRWRMSRGTVKAGRLAGILQSNGYRRIRINSRSYQAHRLVWLWMTDEWPAISLDHVNCNRDDNRWENLREATHSQNKANSLLHSNNTSGLKGVSFFKETGKWMANIGKNRVTYYLGLFDTKESAHEAYVAKARELFGEYARAA